MATNLFKRIDNANAETENQLIYKLGIAMEEVQTLIVSGSDSVLLTAILAELQDIESDIEALLPELQDINTSTSNIDTSTTSIDSKLTSVLTNLTNIKTKLDTIITTLASSLVELQGVNTKLTTVITSLTTLDSDLQDILTELQSQTTILQSIEDQSEITNSLYPFPYASYKVITKNLSGDPTLIGYYSDSAFMTFVFSHILTYDIDGDFESLALSLT